ncbi:Lrp/AsnC family transcriptional regulator [Acinetobacter stercoris]|uniref:Leucine-responsive regulatory protein n=1 Tax=Acinetobacter stercoris TaxID=2126983 RepID=A0A2U3N3B7_9GAMM|nr:MULTISPECIES: Lrp/AsnC family transcriptional regulator [Acinetobacter]SPL72171.1 Leucine-responsive regulatory protein [Acinetobacter stercoris]
MDSIDLKILRKLQANGRLTNQELADQIALSPSACLRRVKALEKERYINGYHALLNASRLGYKVEAFVQVNLDETQKNWHENFMSAIDNYDEIANAYIVTGKANYLLHIRALDFEHFSEFIIHTLHKVIGVRDIQTSMVMQGLKSNGRFIPL